MDKLQLIKDEMKKTYEEGNTYFKLIAKEGDLEFRIKYQEWYSKSIKIVETLAPDRYKEFIGYYEIDNKRKAITIHTYKIQDYMKGIIPNNFEDKDVKNLVRMNMFNQLQILNSVLLRDNSILNNIKSELISKLQDDEIGTARKLLKISPRAAGALVGVVVENHLQEVAKSNQVKISKKNPTISDLNDPLRSSGIIDMATWRKISYIADIRNLCSHKKDTDPSVAQVEDLISSAEWIIKNIF